MSQTPKRRTIEYTPAGETIRAFHQSTAKYRFINGPVGSSKTMACIFEVFRRITEQEPDHTGLRRSRWLVLRSCYDDETEILTEKRGFVLFKDLADDDKVASLVNGKTKFVKPSHYYCSPYVGEMITFKSEGVDFCVTPNHNMFVSKRRGRAQVYGDYEHVKAEELYNSCHYKIQRNAEWTGRTKYSVDFFEWLGFWFAEGCARISNGRYCCDIVQKEPEYVEELFRRADIPYYVQPPTTRSVYCFRVKVTEQTRPLIRELATFGKSISKWVPQWVKEAPAEHIQAFLQGYINGDGYQKGNSVFASTSSKKLADDLQELALRAGWVANVAERPMKKVRTINGVQFVPNAHEYVVTFLREGKYTPHLHVHKEYRHDRGWHKKKYKGNVYCVTVPSHVIYVRRNGKGLWCSNSFPELDTTTIPDWRTWFTDDFGPFRMGKPPTHFLRFGDVRAEIIFMSADDEEGVNKLRGMQLTGVWINEANEISRAVLMMCTRRIGRYPSPYDCTWSGIIGDTNPPDPYHWYAKMEKEYQEGKLHNWQFFTQPPAVLWDPDKDQWTVNPAREGVMSDEYYQDQIAGSTEEEIKVYLAGQYGFVLKGMRVFPEYEDHIHCREGLVVHPEFEIYLGADWGRTPACIIGQEIGGQIRWLDELVTENMGAERFCRELNRFLELDYSGYRIGGMWGDPKGADHSQNDERTVFKIMKAGGLPFQPAPFPSRVNDFTLRREAVAHPLSRIHHGEPEMIISDKCRVTRQGLNGGYVYRRYKISGEERYNPLPDKNHFSHPVEGGQYLNIGLGRGKSVIVDIKQRSRASRQHEQEVDYDIFGR